MVYPILIILILMTMGIIIASYFLLRSILRVVDSVYASSSHVTAGVQQISSSIKALLQGTTEQANGIDQINNAVMQLNTVVQQNAAGAEEMAATCKELASQSIEMQSMMDLLKYGASQPDLVSEPVYNPMRLRLEED